MWPFRPLHTVDSVLRELVEGIEAGTIALDEPEPDILPEAVTDLATQIGHEIAAKLREAASVTVLKHSAPTPGEYASARTGDAGATRESLTLFLVARLAAENAVRELLGENRNDFPTPAE